MTIARSPLICCAIAVSALFVCALPATARAAPLQGKLTVSTEATVVLSPSETGATLGLLLQTPPSYTRGADGLNTGFGSGRWVWGPVVRGGSTGLAQGLWTATSTPNVFSLLARFDLSSRRIPDIFNTKYDYVSAYLTNYDAVTSNVVTFPVEVHPAASMSFALPGIAGVTRNRSFTCYVDWNGFGTDEVVQFFRLESSRWVLKKTVPAGTVPVGTSDPYASVDGDYVRVRFTTSLPSAGNWKAVIYHRNDATDFEYTSAPKYFSVKPSYSSLSLSLPSSVSYNGRRATLSGRLLVNGSAAKYKTVRLYKDYSYYKTLKTDAYGRLKAVVTAGFNQNVWKLRYGGTSTVAASESPLKYTKGKVLYHFSDTGNLLEHVYLRSGRQYQFILDRGYKMEIKSQSTAIQYYPYGTFAFTCKSTGYWSLYAANRDIFDGKRVEVTVW